MWGGLFGGQLCVCVNGANFSAAPQVDRGSPSSAAVHVRADLAAMHVGMLILPKATTEEQQDCSKQP